MKYKTLTLGALKAAFREFFGKEKKSKLTFDELRAKVLPGYWYSIESHSGTKSSNTRSTKIHTGTGGVNLYINKCEELGFEDADSVAESIFCHTDQGVFNLLQLNVKKKV